MGITFECGHCGRPFDVDPSKAGKVGRCKGCARRMFIPPRSTTRPVPTWADEADEVEPALAPAPASAPGSARDALPPRAPANPAGQVLPPRAARPKPSQRRAGAKRQRIIIPSGGRLLQWGFLLILISGAIGGIRLHFQHRGNAGGGAGDDGGRIALDASGPITPDRAGDLIRQGLAQTEAAPAQLPHFPALGPGRAIEPGVMFHEVRLGPLNTSLESLQAAQGGRLWVYLPSRSAGADHTLPCILITAAGTPLLTGNDLGEGSRAEHLPYARAGFAVVAFELDGSIPDNPSDRIFNEGMYRFARAKAGVANAHVAFEYARQMVPAVDPKQISIAGHSSAGVVALLFAATEPQLRSAVAYAPCVDHERRFGPETVGQLRRAGFEDLAVRYSPKNYCQKLLCPLFLFQARDDSNTPFAEAEAFASRLQGQGDAVTFDVVATGGHYQSMIDQGIPHAIAWLRGEPIPAETQVVRRSAPSPMPAPLNPTTAPAPIGPPSPPLPGFGPGFDPVARAKAHQDRVRGQFEAMRQRQEAQRQRMRDMMRPPP